MRLHGKSLTTRLTMLFAAVSTSVLLALGLLIGSLVERHFEDMDLDLLEGKLALLQHAVVSVRTEGDLAGLPGYLKNALIGERGLAVGIWSAAGAPLYLSGEDSFPAASVPPEGKPATARMWTGPDGQRYRGIYGQVSSGVAHEAPVRVALATSLAHHDHFMHAFQVAMWSVVGVAALLSGFLGWVVARRGLAPLRRIARRASDITASKLDQRLETAEIPVELAEVAGTLNAMLARLKESFDRLSGFSSDIAHELRTPLSNLLTQTQVMLSRERSVAEYQDVLASNAEELERLSRTIADMLFLAKADNNLLTPTRETVDLAVEVAGLLAFYEALADEKRLEVSLWGHAEIAGDRLMLRRAVGNLLSNAIRHTPPEGRIAIFLDASEQAVGIRVENTGEDIPPEHLPRLFDRFYRADPSRHQFGEGAGLGLAIVRSIALAHGGAVGASSQGGVSAFSISLPRR